MVWLAALLICAIWAAVFIRSYRGLTTVEDIPSHLPLPERPPLVSVIIAAKEEQESIQETIRHLYHQTYPRLEIIAINDRSSDETGARLDELKAWSDGRPEGGPRLKVVHIANLPEGWLGKNHALYQGYKQANGRFLLFTDADVQFHPDAIRDCMAYVLKHDVDHLTLIPRLLSRSSLLRSFVHVFMNGVFFLYPPWAANDDLQRRKGLGIGAFNLVRKDVYERIGTHRSFPMRPDDDLCLGLRIKQDGWRQRVVSGADRIAVEWYSSLRECIRGLEKNLYAGFGFRLPYALAAVCGLAVLGGAPLTSLLWARGWPLFFLLVSAGFLLGTYLMHVQRLGRESGKEAVWLPVTIFILIGVILRSVWLAHRRRGVYWRGTFYRLKELRNHYRE